MLVRWNLGDKKTWRVVNVPSIADEDRRQLHRELISLKKERTKHVNCMKSLLFAAGFGARIDRTLPQQLEKLHQLASPPLPANLYQRLLREFERWSLVHKQINDIDTERVRRIRTDQSQHMDMVRRLLSLRAVGENSAWLLVQEVFGWREIKNRRQLGGLAGLSPTPYNSGDSEREQGISKAGNTRLRGILVELAWSWLRYQPNSALTLWYKTRFAAGNSRLRASVSSPWHGSSWWRCGSILTAARSLKERSWCPGPRNSGQRRTRPHKRDFIQCYLHACILMSESEFTR